jgi:hypothetical protein
MPGGGVHVTDLSSHPLAAVILFENRGGKLGYRMLTAVRATATFAAPALTASSSTLYAELERVLVQAGLVQREAAAMVNTWRDTWFEAGTRVLYIMPAEDVNSVLPLRVEPTPARVARVFVGRMEVVTEATQRAVGEAIGRGDDAALLRYGRFLGPIADRVLATTTQASDSARIRETVGRAWDSYLHKAAVCE